MGLFDWWRSLFGKATTRGPVVPKTGTDADIPTIGIDRQGATWLEIHQPGRSERGRSREEDHTCKKCGGTLEPVLLTTWGGPAWTDAPVAVDGWRCVRCLNVTTPAFLTPAQVHTLCEQGAHAGRAGRLDEAEFFFRRVSASWTEYSVARMQLGSVYLDRIREEEQGERRPPVLARYEAIALNELLAASSGEPPPIPWVHQKIARILMFRGEMAQARRHLGNARRHPDLTEAEREELDQMEAYIARRGDLYDRGGELISQHMRLLDRPCSNSPNATAALHAGIEMLEAFAALNPTHWQSRWLLGKGHQALERTGEARKWFADCWSLEPEDVNVGREYGETLLVAEEYDAAVAVLRQTLDKKPEDAGLMGNLALGLLLAGADAEALSTIHRARAVDPRDPINQTLEGLIEAVHAGKRPRPRRLLPGGALE
ncbi:MAG: hypothetical protein AAFV53_36935 [Myxococcota bacterium]